MGKILIPRLFRLLLTCLILSPSTLLAADATITVTREQSGREIALKAGDILLIELPAKGGTGYSWAAAGTFPSHLKLLDQTTRQLTEGRPGGPAMQVWRFKAERPGTCELNLAYFRPWEGVGKAVDHFRLKLHIQ